jgi:hypothetical protein
VHYTPKDIQKIYSNLTPKPKTRMKQLSNTNARARHCDKISTFRGEASSESFKQHDQIPVFLSARRTRMAAAAAAADETPGGT